MKNLLKKVRGDKKGFTLAELLVVVAIVGILVAISIPLFTAQLGKARKATNQANMRAAKVAAISQYLSDAKDGKDAVYKYDTKTGIVSGDATKKGTETTIENAPSDEVYSEIYVTVSGTAKDKVTVVMNLNK